MEITRLAGSLSAVKRCQAAECLETFFDLSEIIDFLESLLFDGAETVRKAAAKCLRKISLTGNRGQQLIFKAANFGDVTVRKVAIECLEIKGNEIELTKTRKILLSRINDTSTEVRLTAILTLAKIVTIDQEIVQALSSLLWDRNIEIRIAAARALIKWGGNNVAKHFISCLQSSPCGTFDLEYDFAGIDNLDNRFSQILINAEIITFILRQEDETLVDDFATILKDSMVGKLNGSLFTVFARVIASLNKTEEIIQLWGKDLSNLQKVNIFLAMSVDEPNLDESARVYSEKIIGKLKSASSTNSFEIPLL